MIVCLSPGFIAAGALAGIFSIEAIFIVIKKPYVLGFWKRPFLNKILTVVICLLYAGSSITATNSKINEYIPIAILLVLITVLIVNTIGSIQEIKEYWSTRQETQKVEEKAGQQMSVEESQNAIMKDFEMRFMPTLPLNSPSWRPAEQDPIDFNKWQWDNYPKLGLGPLDSPSRLK